MQMKLYTEEQIRQAMQDAMIPSIYQMLLWGKLTPIELPSDEEIVRYARIVENYHEGLSCIEASNSDARYHSCIKGAKWVTEQIKEQADGE